MYYIYVYIYTSIQKNPPGTRVDERPESLINAKCVQDAVSSSTWPPNATQNAVSTAPKRRFKLNLASSSATWRVQVELGGLFSLEIAQKGLPRSIWSLPNLEKTMKNAVLSSNFEVRAVLHSKRSWMRLGGFLGSNLDVLGVHLAALGTNLGPTWTLLGPT